MKNCFVSLLAAAFASVTFAQRPIAEFDWASRADSDQQLPGKLVTLDGRSALEISNTNDAPLQVHLLTIEEPEISALQYAILGEVKYDSVQGDAYLETWNYFAPSKPGLLEEKYFSRTLGDSGAMAKLAGTSSWRDFALPFNRSGASDPARIELNLYLPGPGTVYISPVRLVEYQGSSPEIAASARAWWSGRSAGWIGGLGGAFIGCLAGLLAWLAGRGIARNFVVGSSLVLILAGAISTLAGVAAVLRGQPYHVWFPLLLLGILLELIIPLRLRDFSRNYQELELRKMASLDA